jgi:hypothetical protein
MRERNKVEEVSHNTVMKLYKNRHEKVIALAKEATIEYTDIQPVYSTHHVINNLLSKLEPR